MNFIYVESIVFYILYLAAGGNVQLMA